MSRRTALQTINITFFFDYFSVCVFMIPQYELLSTRC